MDIKYVNQLLQCKNLLSFLTMFFGLSPKEQRSIFTHNSTLVEGTKLYRIRKDDGKTDFQNPEAWLPPPADKVGKGRFNEKNEPILYVATDLTWLEREVGLEQGDPYYLATYTCKRTFRVGCLLNPNNKIANILHLVARSIPSSSSLTSEERKEFNKTTGPHISLKNIIGNPAASYYIHKEIKNLYDITNKIGKLVLAHNNNGIRYASAFNPFELAVNGTMFTLDGLKDANYALTETGRKNIEFVSAEPRCCQIDYDLKPLFEYINENLSNSDKVVQ